MSTWHRVPLTALANYVNGYPFKPEDHGQDGWPIVRIEQLKDPDTRYDYFDGKVPRENYIADGDLIFSWSASLFLRIWDRGPAILNQHLFKVVPNPDIDKLFLKYCIEHNLPELTKASHGSTMQHITRRELERFHVAVPSSKTEQTTIADILTAVDQAIEQTEALIAKQRRVKAGLLHDLLTRGIDEHGRLRDASTHRFKPSPVGLVPEEWEVVPLGSISAGVTSGSRGWARYYSVEGAKFIRIGNLTRQHVNLILDDVQHVHPPLGSEGKRTSLEVGDLLISITADLGIIGVVPEGIGEAYINQHIALVKLDQGRVNPWWIGNFLAGHTAQKLFSALNESGAKAGLNLPTVASFPVPVPDMREQIKITQLLRQVDTEVVHQEAQLLKLRRLKTGLMQDMLSGRVSVAELAARSDVTHHDKEARDSGGVS